VTETLRLFCFEALFESGDYPAFAYSSRAVSRSGSGVIRGANHPPFGTKHRTAVTETLRLFCFEALFESEG
jgi:hypothetical protein